MNENQTFEQAKCLHIGPLSWVDLPFEDTVRALQAETFVAAMSDEHASVINIVYDHDGTLGIPISLQIDNPTPLSEVLELLAQAAWLIVRYLPTGIILSDPPTEEHVDEEHVDEEDAAPAEPAHIPGMPWPAPEPLPAPIAPRPKPNLQPSSKQGSRVGRKAR